MPFRKEEIRTEVDKTHLFFLGLKTVICFSGKQWYQYPGFSAQSTGIVFVFQLRWGGHDSITPAISTWLFSWTSTQVVSILETPNKNQVIFSPAFISRNHHLAILRASEFCCWICFRWFLFTFYHAKSPLFFTTIWENMSWFTFFSFRESQI